MTKHILEFVVYLDGKRIIIIGNDVNKKSVDKIIENLERDLGVIK